VGNRCASHVTPLYPQKLALTSPTGGGRSVGMVRSRTKATEFSFSFFFYVSVSVEHQSSHLPENCTLAKEEVIVSGKVISQLRRLSKFN